jgi:anhydro-N-acetylmuramic acid kinase
VRFLGKRVASTLQIGDGSVLAERLGVPVVSDFRPRDMAAGGQGAPLVPYVDYLLLRNPRAGRVALNIGGIANVTAIPAGASPSKVIAFDTGPGNMVIDSLLSRFTNGARRFDEGGKLAARGKVSASLLRLLLRDRYYRKLPPKSAGREDYGAEFIQHLIDTRLPLEDIVATATALTAATIGIGIREIVMQRMKVQEVVVSGGGAHNRTLLGFLGRELPEVRIRPFSDFGIDVDAKEAIAFAVLAHETWLGRPSNLPAATGARAPVILGKISPGPPKKSPSST